MEKRDVLVISTGGTVEKSYHELEGSFKNRESIFKKRLLEHLRLPYTRVHFLEIMAKDSLDMDDKDRQEIGLRLKEQFSKQMPIVVLHGTDTMELTLQHCFKYFSNPPVPVIFTGAMRPMDFTHSDGPQNIIESLMAAQLAAPGYYISFHNRLFVAPKVRKNREKGTFEEVK